MVQLRAFFSADLWSCETLLKNETSQSAVEIEIVSELLFNQIMLVTYLKIGGSNPAAFS